MLIYSISHLTERSASRKALWRLRRRSSVSKVSQCLVIGLNGTESLYCGSESVVNHDTIALRCRLEGKVDFFDTEAAREHVIVR